MGLVQYESRPENTIQTVFYVGTTELHEGAPVFFISAADPTDAVFGGAAVGAAVEAGPSTHIPPKFAGIVHQSSAGVAANGHINIIKPHVGDVVTIAVAVGVDAGDGCVLADTDLFLADGGAHAIAADEFFALYTEDDAANPHGTSAISASAGLIEAVYTGVNRSS